MLSKLLLPKVSYIRLTQSLKSIFRGWFLQECKRMWDVVLETEITNVREPVSATLTESSEELNSNVVKDVSWKAAYHAKE